jgi:hypothetical protein
VEPGGRRRRRALALPAGGLAAAGLAATLACGQPAGLEGWDVTLTLTEDCTQTNLNRACVDPLVLAATTVEARWLFDPAETGIGVALTTEDGITLAGWRFANDGRVALVPGCGAEGGVCSFVRHRTLQVDANNNDCARSTERVFAGHTDPDDQTTITGVMSDEAIESEQCGTPTIRTVAWTVAATRADEPVLAREEAQ